MGFLISTPIGIGVLSAVAFLLSLVMLYKGLSQAGLPGCGAGSGCGAVASSRWSRWLGVPVAAPGALLYLALVICVLLGHVPADSRIQRVIWSIMLVAGFIATGAALWFVGLQLFSVRRMCPYCTALHACGLIATILIINTVRTSGLEPILSVPAATFVAGATLAILIGGQVLFPSREYVLTPAASEDTSSHPGPQSGRPEAVLPSCLPPADSARLTPPPEHQAPAVSHVPTHPVVSRIITVAKGKISLSTADWPIIGSAAATHIIPKLLDYTCEDCRHMHQLLKNVLPHFAGELAILVVPVPLEPACNPLVKRLDSKHANACVYARLALAVWLADPAAFPSFHEQMLGRRLVPAVEEAYQWAEHIVGPSVLAALLRSTPVQKRLTDGVTMLGLVGGGNLPKLVLPHNVLWGRVPSAGQLAQVMAQQLSLRPVAALQIHPL